MDDIYPSKKDSDSGVGSDNGDKRLSATEVKFAIRFLPSVLPSVCKVFKKCVEYTYHTYTGEFPSFLTNTSIYLYPVSTSSFLKLPHSCQ